MMLPVANLGTIANSIRLVNRIVFLILFKYLFWSYATNSVSVLVYWLISHRNERVDNERPSIVRRIELQPRHLVVLAIRTCVTILMPSIDNQSLGSRSCSYYRQQCTYKQGCYHHKSLSAIKRSIIYLSVDGSLCHLLVCFMLFFLWYVRRTSFVSCILICLRVVICLPEYLCSDVYTEK